MRLVRVVRRAGAALVLGLLLLGLSAAGAAAEGGSAVVSWGDNLNEELDQGFQTFGPEETPASAQKLTGVLAVSSGFQDGFALLANHTLVGWGTGIYGQLGDGAEPAEPETEEVGEGEGQPVVGEETERKSEPVPVVDEAGTTQSEIVEMSAVGDHAVALLQSGRVATWGGSDVGQRGNGESGNRAEAESEGTFVPRDRAVEVGLPEPVKQVAAGGEQTTRLRPEERCTRGAETPEGETRHWGRTHHGSEQILRIPPGNVY